MICILRQRHLFYWATGLVISLLSGGWLVQADANPQRPNPQRPNPQQPVVERFGPVDTSIAPGTDLSLVRYEIPAGMQLPVHHHNGAQIGWLQSGELHYFVVKGTVQVYTLDANGTQQLIQTLQDGDSTTLTPGQWVVELGNVIHYGRSGDTEPVVIFTSTLLSDGSPLATPVELKDVDQPKK